MIAIDPGADGGIAVSGETVEAWAMPDGMTEQADLIRSLAVIHRTAVIENVGGYRPGNSGPSAAKFARHVGHLEAILYMCGVSTVKVTPQKWMKAIGTWPSNKEERKRAIKEAMARLYPALSVTLKTADALGILTWAMKEGK